MKTIRTIVIMGLTLAGPFSQSANVTQINRYATVANQPLASQVNPLLTVQQMHFPQTVSTVGDAIVYWLQYSGFRLADEPRLLPVFKILMKQPLPQVDRNFGPLTIQDGLIVLAGRQEFTLVQNPLTRTVNFKLKHQGHSA